MSEKICPYCNGEGVEVISITPFREFQNCPKCEGSGIVASKTYYDPEGWLEENKKRRR